MQLILAFHHHLPPGKTAEETAGVVERAYLPLLDALEAHPRLRVDVHYSGTLLDTLAASRSDLIERLATMSDQLEWMGGGYFEPPFPAIPPSDQVEQMLRLRARIGELFGQAPRGAWLTDLRWDPTLAQTLAAVGVEYTVLDGQTVGAGDHGGPLATDYLGDTVAVFAINEELRQAVPGREPDEVVELLAARQRHSPDALMVYAGDVHTFGWWAEDEGREHDPKWLERWFAALERAGDWLTSTTFERALDGRKPEGSVPIAASASRPRPAASGADWHESFRRYPAANTLYRKMLWMSKRTSGGKAPPEARTAVLAAQEASPYRPDAFGGVYLPHLRAEAHRRLIEAEVAMDRADRRGRAWASVTEQDWDADLHPEVVVGLPDQSWVLDPVEGGTLHYYDDKPALWAVADVMARRPEPYHQFVDPSPAYDAHSHRWLTERLVPAHLPPEGMLTSIDQDLAPLPRLPYRLESSEQGRGAVTIELVGEPGDGSVRKRLRASGRRLSVTYELTGLPAGRFGSTLPVSVEEGAGSIRVDGGEWTGTDRLARLSGHRFRFQHRARQQEVLVVSRIPCHLYVIPIRTWVTTRRALDQIMQGVVLWPHWLIEGQGTYELDIEIGDGGT